MATQGRLKKLASETAVYGLSSVIGRLIGFLLVPLYTNVLAEDEYGVFVLVYAAFVFLNIIYTHGMESAYLRFASGDHRKDQRAAFSTSSLSLLLSSLLIGAFIYFSRAGFAIFLGLQEQWLFVFNYMVIILALDSLAIIPFAELRLSNRPWYFAFVRIAGILINVGLNVWLVLVQKRGVEGILISNVISSSAVLLLLLPVYLKNIGLSFNSAIWKSMLKFGFPILLAGVAYSISDKANVYFLGQMEAADVIRLYGDQIDVSHLQEKASRIGPGVFGQYVTGIFGGVFKIAVIMMLITQMFRFAWQPFFLQHAQDEDAHDLFSSVFTVFNAVGLIVFLAVSFLARELVQLPLPGGRTLLPESYWIGLSVVPLALIAYLFQGWYYNFTAGFYIKKKTRFFMYCTVAGGIVAVLINYFYIPQFGMMAAVASVAAAYFVMALMLWVYSRKIYPVGYAWGKVGLAWVLALAVLATWISVPTLQVWYFEIGLVLLFALSLIPAGLIPLSGLKRKN